jgi:hypothetical protein
MKKIFAISFLLIVVMTSSSQQVASYPTLTKQDYLKRSRHQRVASGILLGGGLLCLDLGGRIGGKSGSGFSRVAGATLLISGAAGVFSSAPLFVFSFVTKSKGMKLSVTNQMVPQLQNSNLVNKPAPSFNLKISL